MHTRLEIASCLGHVPQSLNVYMASTNRLKSMFYISWHCYLIISYQCHVKWYLLRIMVFFVRGRVQKTSRKTDRRKTSINEYKKNEEYKESQITTMSIFGFIFFIKSYILLKNILVKGKKVKSSLYHPISFTVFMRCRIFETQ